MSDSFEDQVRTVMNTRMINVSAERVERIVSRGYKVRDRRLPLLPTAGVGAIATLAAAIAIIVSLSSNAQQAFAGWTATPQAVSASALVAARRACGHVPANRVLASDARGPYTSIVFVTADRPRQCVVKGARVLLQATTAYPLRAYASVPAGKVMLPVITHKTFGKTTARLKKVEARYQAAAASSVGDRVDNRLLAEIDATQAGPGTMSAALGIAGEGVTGVTVILKDGDQVQATVENGWYVAWWPGATEPGGGEAERVAVSTASSTRAAALPPPQRLGTYRTPKGCLIGEACSPLSPIEAAPIVARSLESAYSTFRTTRPANESTAPKVVRITLQHWHAGGGADSYLGGAGADSYLGDAMAMRNGYNAGLDPSQLRSLKLGTRITFWFIPGSEDSCEARESGGTGGSSCGPISAALENGVIDSPGTVYVHHTQRYVIGGWVPNGNATIRIKLASGAIKSVRVRHNAFVAYFASPPMTLSFRNGYGKLVHHAAPQPNEV